MAKATPHGWQSPRRKRLALMPQRGGACGVEWDLDTLFAPDGPPIRRTELLAHTVIFASPSGRTLLDFRQTRLATSDRRKRGQTHHAAPGGRYWEHGELSTRPLRFAAATDRYTLHGEVLEDMGTAVHLSRFSLCGGQGSPGELRMRSGDGVFHSDMERTGWFECLDPLVNGLHENVLWSMHGDFFDIPTDSPRHGRAFQVNGRLGLAPTGSFLRHSRLSVDGLAWRSRGGAGGSRGPRLPFSCADVIDRPVRRPPPGATLPWSCLG